MTARFYLNENLEREENLHKFIDGRQFSVIAQSDNLNFHLRTCAAFTLVCEVDGLPAVPGYPDMADVSGLYGNRIICKRV